jgi:hypothetical protein
MNKESVMQVLILGDDHAQQARLAAAMMKKGFQVICVETAGAASSYIRGQFIDVLILAETRSGRIGQSCACVTQSRNPQVSVIVITDRTGAATQELFDEVPLLYGVIGLQMAPGMVAAIALASILPPESGLQPVEAESVPVAEPVRAVVMPVVPVRAACGCGIGRGGSTTRGPCGTCFGGAPRTARPGRAISTGPCGRCPRGCFRVCYGAPCGFRP